MFPHRKVSAKALARTEEQRRDRNRWESEGKQKLIKAGAYAEHQRQKRFTGVPAVNNYLQWNRKELSALLLPLTTREIAVLLHRSIPAVEIKIEYIKTVMRYREGRVKLKDLPDYKRRRVRNYLDPDGHGRFASDNITWLIERHGLRSETFRVRDEFGNIVPTITRKR